MNNELFVKKLYFEVSNQKGNIPFIIESIFKSDEISPEQIKYLDDLIDEGSSFLEKTNNGEYVKTYRIEEACLRTLKELEKEDYDSRILIMLKENPIILHNELKRWFDTKHNSMLSYVIDKYWHNFVLYAKEYENWCFDNYGCMLYHSPKFPYENKNILDEEIIFDVMEYFKIYSKQYELDERILLYNFPFLLSKKGLDVVQIKEILLELVD